MTSGDLESGSVPDPAADLPKTDAGGGAVPEPVDEEVDVDTLPGGLRGAVEAVLMVVDEPVDEVSLAEVLRRPVPQVVAVLEGLRDACLSDERGYEIRRLGSGWRVYSRHEFGPVIDRFLLDGRRARLTQAALETLAVIAYRQPVTRAQIGAVRGVNVDGVVRTLVSRGLVEEVGQETEHGAARYGTTDYFLQRMGLDNLDDLPPLAPHLPDLAALTDLTEGDTL